MMVPKGFHKDVREMCEAEGWEVWSTYNDKRKDGSRRVSYVQGGRRVDENTKKKILDRVNEIINKYNLKGVVAKWVESEKWGYGKYDRLAVYFPA